MNTHTNNNPSHNHNSDDHTHDPYKKDSKNTDKNHEHYVSDTDLAPVARPTLLIFRFLIFALLIAGVLLIWRLLKNNNEPQQVAMTPEEVMEQVEDVEEATQEEDFATEEEDLNSSEESDGPDLVDEGNGTTRLYVPMVFDVGIGEASEDEVFGCGNWIDMIPHDVPETLGVLSGTYRALFNNDVDLGEQTEFGPRNVVTSIGGIDFESVQLSDGVAVLYLSGTPVWPGVCSTPAFTKQIESAAFQFPTVDTLVVMLNNAPFDWCNYSDADVSESGCDTIPRPWVVQR